MAGEQVVVAANALHAEPVFAVEDHRGLGNSTSEWMLVWRTSDMMAKCALGWPQHLGLSPKQEQCPAAMLKCEWKYATEQWAHVNCTAQPGHRNTCLRMVQV